MNRHLWLQTSTVDPARYPGPAAVQVANRDGLTKYLRWLRGRGGKEHLNVIERSEAGHWHNHTLLRVPWLDSAACAESGLSWRELAAAMDPDAIGDRARPLPRLLAEMREHAVRFGLAPQGFELAPVRFPLAMADYLTMPMLDRWERPMSTVIGVNRFSCSRRFFDRDDGDDATLPRMRRDATKRNAPGDSDAADR